MAKQSDNPSVSQELSRIARGRMLIGLIVLLAFGLRLHQLGQNGLWNDEAGQTLAALEPTLEGMIAVERTHMMALPLDYLLTRIVSRVGLEEAVLRFPAVIWATLSVSLLFALVKRHLGRSTALVAAYLLAISALHIRYSQEARFYSSLLCFYLLASYLIVRALQLGTSRSWMRYTAVAAVGAYFHPYVLLSLANGFFYLILRRKDKKLKFQIIRLALNTLILVAIFLPAYLYFSKPRQTYELLQFNSSFLQALAGGVDWQPMGLWGVIMAAWLLAGSLMLVRSRNAMLALLLAGLAQIPLVVLADWLSGYWFTGRQILHLLPIVLTVVAVGIIGFARLAARLVNRPTPNRLVTPIVIVVLLVLSSLSVPRVNRYYRWPRSNAREIAAYLVETYDSRTQILVEPAHEEKIYRYYLTHIHDRPDIVPSLKAFEPAATNPETGQGGRQVFLAISASNAEKHRDSISELGFEKVPLGDGKTDWAHWLFVGPSR